MREDFTKAEAAEQFEKDNAPGEARHTDPKLQCQCFGCKTHRGEKKATDE